ncbi:MAG: hypothetical protein QXH59_08170 [Candidatus Caldarchaeum sp.]
MSGYITTKSQLKDVLSRLEIGETLVLFKTKYWCKDPGFHYDLFIRRLSETEYMMTYTDYHGYTLSRKQ